MFINLTPGRLQTCSTRQLRRHDDENDAVIGVNDGIGAADVVGHVVVDLPLLSAVRTPRRQITRNRFGTFWIFPHGTSLHPRHIGHGGRPDVVRNGFSERHFVHSVSFFFIVQ
jgi:hypothetical protein